MFSGGTMKLKRKIIAAALAASTMLLCSANAFAGVNFGNGDGSDFKHGTEDNGWLLKKDNGSNIYDGPYADLEALRLTVYEAETQTKVYRTLDVTGESSISSISNIMHHADGTELIPKTTWLSSSYVGTTYNAVDAVSVGKFQRATIDSSRIQGSGYTAEYVVGLSDIDIVSANNTSNYEAIKAYIGDEQFIKNVICHFIPELEYDDFVDGKYKIAFEPVAYFRYDGMNWALSATECGILNHYDKVTYSAAWNSTCNMRSLMGPLTHSNLPRSAFLVEPDLGVSVYAPTESDYYSSYHINSSTGLDDHDKYNSDICIIRCMGIGTLGNDPPDNDEEEIVGNDVAEYHTNIYVYTSFNFVNNSSDNMVSSAQFSIFNSHGDTPKLREQLCDDNRYVINAGANLIHDADGNVTGASPYTVYGYTSDETEIKYQDSNARIKVFIENDSTSEYHSPYKLLGTYRDGDFVQSGSNDFSYTITSKSTGRTIATGSVAFSCPASEEAMGWFKWRTPTSAQDIEIKIKSNKSGVYLLDKNGSECTTLVIDAAISKVEEITPPDPQVSATRPSWHRNYSLSSVEANISNYAPRNNNQSLEWYVWTYGWSQESLETASVWYNLITDYPDYSNPSGPYFGASYEDKQLIFVKRWGIDNRYYPSAQAEKMIGSVYEGAVLLSGEAHKITYSVSLDAEMEITPSTRCHTATYSDSDELYTMKSGYGIQIKVTPTITGDTEYCTDTQKVNTLFSEFNFNRQSSAKYNRLLEKIGGAYVFKTNKYSTYNDRVHFTPIWYPDGANYTVYAEVFDIWCPAGQLSLRLTDHMKIRGNVYDDWHIAPTHP